MKRKINYPERLRFTLANTWAEVAIGAMPVLALAVVTYHHGDYRLAATAYTAVALAVAIVLIRIAVLAKRRRAFRNRATLRYDFSVVDRFSGPVSKVRDACVRAEQRLNPKQKLEFSWSDESLESQRAGFGMTEETSIEAGFSVAAKDMTAEQQAKLAELAKRAPPLTDVTSVQVNWSAGSQRVDLCKPLPERKPDLQVEAGFKDGKRRLIRCWGIVSVDEVCDDEG